MKGWIKHFADGTLETGTDRDTRLGRASWTRGRLRDITRVEAWQDRNSIAVAGTGSFWQSDDCEAILYGNDSRIVARRIQKRIEPTDIVMFIDADELHLQVTILSQLPLEVNVPPGVNRRIVPLAPDVQNKWLTVEMNVRDGETKIGFMETQI
jgi:hypothetical protein